VSFFFLSTRFKSFETNRNHLRDESFLDRKADSGRLFFASS
jgi:hypothetical protein